jgi:hypothetical protein
MPDRIGYSSSGETRPPVEVESETLGVTGLVAPGIIEQIQTVMYGGHGGQQVDASPSPPARSSLEERFQALVTEWRQSTNPRTTLADLLSHPAYNRIIGMGLAAREPVARLILRDLAAHPRHWFHALEEIGGEDPVPEDATTFEEFRRAWLSWGRGKGLL